MSSKTPNGKYVQIDTEFPDAVAICDRSGQIFNYEDMRKQMEYRGQSLVWTGMMVGKDYLDQPNPGLMPPILPPDPVPLKLARPPQGYSGYANLQFNPANNIQMPANTIGTVLEGIPALTIAQREAQLNSVWFGSPG